MTHTHEISTHTAAFIFLLAGRAVFTVVNDATGGRFTFKVVRVEKEGRDPVHFVNLLAGPDNTTDFVRLGMIFDETNFVVPREWSIGSDAPSAQAFRWVFGRLAASRDLATVRFLHEGRCGRCSRVLTVPASIETGLGPVCAGK